MKLLIVFRKSLHSFQCPWDFNGLSKNYRKLSKVSKCFRLGLRDDAVTSAAIQVLKEFRPLIPPAIEQEVVLVLTVSPVSAVLLVEIHEALLPVWLLSAN